MSVVLAVGAGVVTPPVPSAFCGEVLPVRAETRAEGVVGRYGLYLVLFWDLMKAYDTIDHGRLIQAAEEHKIDMIVLRLMVRAYRWQRVLLLGGLAA